MRPSRPTVSDMRILMTTSLYPTPAAPYTFGGAELFVRRVAERFVEDGHEVEIIRSRPRTYSGTETVNGATIRSTKQNNIYLAYGKTKPAPARLLWHLIDDNIWADSLLAERIAAFKPDVLHSNTLVGLGADIWRVARGRGVPVVHTLHDYYLTCARGSRFNGGGNCQTTCRSCSVLTRGRRRKSRYVTALVGVSQRVIDIHQREGLFLDTPIKAVVRNASNMVGSVTPETTLAPLSIGFMGRMSYEKGMTQLAQAFALLPAGVARLVVAGKIDEAEQAELKALAPNADIVFLGYVKPADFFRQVDVAIAPSLWEEPGALVIAEALAAGRPVIVSPFGGSPEAIVPGETGWIVQPEAKAMAELVVSIAARPEQVRRMQHRLMHETVHRTMGDVNRAYLDIYRQAIDLERGAAP